jgi:choline dehydrogenase-like flavoprotein
MIAKGIDGTGVELDGHWYELKVRPFPQGRNGIPNSDYNSGEGFVPVGAVSTNQVEEGGRCQGNNACVPICPVQAKCHAGKTLAKALQSQTVTILPRTVASKVQVGSDGRVSYIEFKHYDDPASPGHTTGTARGQIYVLSANAIENARLLLASDCPAPAGWLAGTSWTTPIC